MHHGCVLGVEVKAQVIGVFHVACANARIQGEAVNKDLGLPAPLSAVSCRAPLGVVPAAHALHHGDEEPQTLVSRVLILTRPSIEGEHVQTCAVREWQALCKVHWNIAGYLKAALRVQRLLNSRGRCWREREADRFHHGDALIDGRWLAVSSLELRQDKSWQHAYEMQDCNCTVVTQHSDDLGSKCWELFWNEFALIQGLLRED